MTDVLADRSPALDLAEIYLVLHRHLKTHPDLAPITLAASGAEGLPTGQIDIQPDGRDATAAAEWAESLTTRHDLYAQAGWAHTTDAIVTMVGELGPHTVTVWTQVRGLGTVLGLPDPGDEWARIDIDPGVLREFDDAYHPRPDPIPEDVFAGDLSEVSLPVPMLPVTDMPLTDMPAGE